MSKNNTYPGFPYPSSDLTEFMCGFNFVVLATVHKQVVRHDIDDIPPFRQWLVSQGVKDITDEAGGLIVDIYTNHLK